jgi:hypothetical protein
MMFDAATRDDEAFLSPTAKEEHPPSPRAYRLGQSCGCADASGGLKLVILGRDGRRLKNRGHPVIGWMKA